MDQNESFYSQFLEMTRSKCDQPQCYGEHIGGLCLNQICKLPSATSYTCAIKLHIGCQPYIKLLSEIPQLILTFQYVLPKLIDLKCNITKIINTLYKIIEEILQPISKYQECQNITNTNNIGTLLKQEKQIEAKIYKEFDKIEVQIRSELQQCRENLFKKFVSLDIDAITIQGILFKDRVQNLCNDNKEQEAMQIVEDLRGKTLKDQRLYNLKGANKFLGGQLYELKKYQERWDVTGYDKGIKTKSNSIISLFSKGIHTIILSGAALQNLQRYQEAMQCYENILRIDPSSYEARQYLTRLKLILN